MDPSELKTYEQQLAQVQGALTADPSNSELVNLETELKNLIDLTKQLIGDSSSSLATSSSGKSTSQPKVGRTASATPPSSSQKAESPVVASFSPRQASGSSQATAPVKHFEAGDECQAKYAADGRWYPARVVSVGGAANHRVYTILFKGYSTTELLTADSLRLPRGAAHHSSGEPASSNSSHVGAGIGGVKRDSTTTKLTPEEEAERERKRKRNEKKAEKYSSKAAEQTAKANSWQKFAKKGEKKGIMKGGEKSMFKTPDDPLAKVGVVGAGRGMTNYETRKKHTYEED